MKEEVVLLNYDGVSTTSKESRNVCIDKVKEELTLNKKVIATVTSVDGEESPYSENVLLSLIDLEIEKRKNNSRELDMLLSAGEIINACILSSKLSNQNIKSKIITREQAGITNRKWLNVGIFDVYTERVSKELKEFDVVIIAGL